MTRELIISSIQALWTSPAILESHQDRHSLPAILGFIKVATRQDFYSSPATLGDSPGFLLVTRDARGLARISTHHPRRSGTRLSGPRPARRLAHRELAYHGLAPLADSLIVNSSITDSPRLGTRPKRLRHRRLAYRRLATLGDSPAAASPSWAHLLRTRPRGLAMIGSRHSSKSGIRHSPISGSHCAPEHTIIEPQAASTRRLKPRGLLPLGIFR